MGNLTQVFFRFLRIKMASSIPFVFPPHCQCLFAQRLETFWVNRANLRYFTYFCQKTAKAFTRRRIEFCHSNIFIVNNLTMPIAKQSGIKIRNANSELWCRIKFYESHCIERLSRRNQSETHSSMKIEKILTYQNFSDKVAIHCF